MEQLPARPPAPRVLLGVRTPHRPGGRWGGSGSSVGSRPSPAQISGAGGDEAGGGRAASRARMCVPSMAVTLAGLWGHAGAAGAHPKAFFPLDRNVLLHSGRTGGVPAWPRGAEVPPRFKSGSGAGIGIVSVTLRDPEDLCVLCLQINDCFSRSVGGRSAGCSQGEETPPGKPCF